MSSNIRALEDQYMWEYLSKCEDTAYMLTTLADREPRDGFSKPVSETTHFAWMPGCSMQFAQRTYTGPKASIAVVVSKFQALAQDTVLLSLSPDAMKYHLAPSRVMGMYVALKAARATLDGLVRDYAVYCNDEEAKAQIRVAGEQAGKALNGIREAHAISDESEHKATETLQKIITDFRRQENLTIPESQLLSLENGPLEASNQVPETQSRQLVSQPPGTAQLSTAQACRVVVNTVAPFIPGGEFTVTIVQRAVDAAQTWIYLPSAYPVLPERDFKTFYTKYLKTATPAEASQTE
ncbi:MAG: hypothetical protein KDK78_03925 [Chlamydiia bacterium]|nr:hypothetical protein [Chlamydiia bacterium]